MSSNKFERLSKAVAKKHVNWPVYWPHNEDSKDAELFFKELRLAGESVIGRSGYWVNDLCISWRDGYWYVMVDPLVSAIEEGFPYGRMRRYKRWTSVEKVVHKYLDDPATFLEKVVTRWCTGYPEEGDREQRQTDA